ncbi:MAG: hypothetical protein ACI8P9_004807 [Parasphingorhabdus sp.]|jgi:hypothetical protein
MGIKAGDGESVQEAINRSVAGDKIIITKGRYQNRLAFRNRHGTAGKWITLTGDDDQEGKALFGEKFLSKRKKFIGMDFFGDRFSSTWWKIAEDTAKKDDNDKWFDFLSPAPTDQPIFRQGAAGLFEFKSNTKWSTKTNRPISIELPSGNAKIIEPSYAGALMGGQRVPLDCADKEIQESFDALRPN